MFESSDMRQYTRSLDPAYKKERAVRESRRWSDGGVVLDTCSACVYDMQMRSFECCKRQPLTKSLATMLLNCSWVTRVFTAPSVVISANEDVGGAVNLSFQSTGQSFCKLGMVGLSGNIYLTLELLNVSSNVHNLCNTLIVSSMCKCMRCGLLTIYLSLAGLFRGGLFWNPTSTRDRRTVGLLEYLSGSQDRG